MKPVISIIIPLYNKEKSINSTIQSLLSQKTSVPFEIIIVDDGSTDKSAQIVKKYAEKDSRIAYFKQENAGPSAARNAGIRKAMGEWIIFFDADDIMLPKGIETLYQTAIKYPNINFACSSFYLGKNYILFPNIRDRIVKNAFYGYVMRQLFPRAGCFIYRKEGIPDFRYDESIKRWEDTEVILNYFRKKEPIITSSAFVMSYRTSFADASEKRELAKDFVGKIVFSRKNFWEKICLYRF